MSHPEDIIAEMAREMFRHLAFGNQARISAGEEEPPTWDRAFGFTKNCYLEAARACWAVVSKHQGWRPIETAPRVHSRVVMLYVPHLGPRPAEWDESAEAWVSPVDKCTEYDDASHWMPLDALPPPPSSAEEGT